MNAPTLVMGDDEKRRARQRSLHSLYPPLRLPGYEQEHFLGKGAFGEVWVATDSNSGRPVAIKFYSRRSGLDWQMLAREVDKLRHLFADRYVVQLLAVGWDADPPYFVMEYMENGSLEDLLRSGPLPVPEAVALFREIAIGLVHAHGKGILHCDIKPANILLDQDGKPRLADFGQARLPHEQTPSLGTLFYMAPEQADLEAAPDARWDVYALGAVLYQMLTGVPPYRPAGGSAELAQPGPLADRLRLYREMLQNAPKPRAHRDVPGVDRALADIVSRALAVKPHERFANVQAVLTALDLRARQQRQRPLVLLGTVGPALVMLVMAVIAGWLFLGIVGTAREQVTGRALESNRFAAQAEAQRIAAQLRTRWQILKHDAQDPQLQQWLEKLLPPASFTAEDSARLNEWARQRHQHWDTLMPEARASLWFIDDWQGYQRGCSEPGASPGGPYSSPAAFLDRYFGWRDYFHGQGHNLPQTDRPPEDEKLRPVPCTLPHRSTVYRRQRTRTWTVAFSVPVFARSGVSSNPIGILGMSTDLGEATQVESSRGRYSVLIDLRADERGERGLILWHPYLAGVRELPETERFHFFYNPGLANGGGPVSFRGDYVDPVSEVFPAFRGKWLASAEPVRNPGAEGEEQDPGWLILVQEPARQALEPIDDLTGTLIRGGLVALVTAATAVTALWCAVMILLTESRYSRKFWRRLGLASSSSSSPRSTSSPSRPEPQPAPAPPEPLAPATVKMDIRNPSSGRRPAPGPPTLDTGPIPPPPEVTETLTVQRSNT